MGTTAVGGFLHALLICAAEACCVFLSLDATKSWANKRDTCSSPWRDDKATPFQFDTDTWGRLLEVSCAF